MEQSLPFDDNISNTPKTGDLVNRIYKKFSIKMNYFELIKATFNREDGLDNFKYRFWAGQPRQPDDNHC